MKKLLALGLLTVYLAAPSPGHASPGDNPQRRLQYIDNNGTLHETELSNSAKQQAFVAHAKKLAPGTLLMTLDGQIYILQDERMADGQMMSEMLMAP